MEIEHDTIKANARCLFSMLKNVFRNLAGLRLFGEVVNHVCFMDLRRPRVARRSNVGLILFLQGTLLLSFYIDIVLVPSIDINNYMC